MNRVSNKKWKAVPVNCIPENNLVRRKLAILENVIKTERDFYKSSPIYIEKGRTNKVSQLDDTINSLEEKKAKLSIDVHQKLEDIHRAVDEKKNLMKTWLL